MRRCRDAEITVHARQFDFQFECQGGLLSKTLKVPVDQPVKLIMRSSDVLHALYVPAFRIKQDIVPGRYTIISFKATVLGTFPLYCAELCGPSHSQMTTVVEVVTYAEFEKWLKMDRFRLNKLSEPEWQAYRKGDVAALRKRWPQLRIPTMAGHGRELFDLHGCGTCHTTTTRKLVGPGLAGLFGSTRKLIDGRTATVDEAYLRRALTEPSADIPVGYAKPSQMDALLTRPDKPTPREIVALIAYLKTLKK